jgi:hypothetical protein
MTINEDGKHATIHSSERKRRSLSVVVELPMLEGGDYSEVDTFASGRKTFCKGESIHTEGVRDKEYRSDVVFVPVSASCLFRGIDIPIYTTLIEL